MIGLFTDPDEILEPGYRYRSNLGGIQNIRAKTYYSAVLSREKEQCCIKFFLSNLFGRQGYASSCSRVKNNRHKGSFG